MATADVDIQSCIRECLECYQVCRREAMQHCLEVGGKHLEPEHFRLMHSCAEICRTSADFMLVGSPLHANVCAACAEVCEACARSCETVGDMDECIRACRRCAESCRKMAAGHAQAGDMRGSHRQAGVKAPM